MTLCKERKKKAHSLEFLMNVQNLIFFCSCSPSTATSLDRRFLLKGPTALRLKRIRGVCNLTESTRPANGSTWRLNGEWKNMHSPPRHHHGAEVARGAKERTAKCNMWSLCVHPICNSKTPYDSVSVTLQSASFHFAKQQGWWPWWFCRQISPNCFNQSQSQTHL